MLMQFWRFREYGRVHLRVLGARVELRLAELVADLAQPWPLALVIDGMLRGVPRHGPLALLSSATGPSPLALLTAAAAAVLVVTLASGGFEYLGDRVMNGAGERITAAIRNDVFAHLQRLPMSYHDRQAVGELTSRICVDTDRIEDGLVDLFSTQLPGLLSLIGLATVLLSADWRFVSIAVRLKHGGVLVTEEVANNTTVPKIFIGASACAHHLFARMGWRHARLD